MEEGGGGWEGTLVFLRFNTLVFTWTFALIKDLEESAGIFYSLPETHFLAGNLQTFYKDGVGFVSDLWHRLSAERIPDGLDCGPQFFFFFSSFFPLSVALSLSLFPSSSPPFFPPLRTEQRAWVAWHKDCILE